jgi:phosphoribosylaminoimidazolecarboxamide formyltransferase/IMP cyclohydrolase
MRELSQAGIPLLDIVVVNLYPFLDVIMKEDSTEEEALENIDIGGPTMVRAAAKNFPYVIVLVDPEDYSPILGKLRSSGLDLAQRRRLAHKAFQHVAAYDSTIARWLSPEAFPKMMAIPLVRERELKYGENPHQRAYVYVEQGRSLPFYLKGEGELSFNNLLDIDSALNLLSEFDVPAVAIIKHGGPCGLAWQEDLISAYERALAGDPVSAFGGIVAVNRAVSSDLASEISRTHFDVITASGYEDGALDLLQRKKGLKVVSFDQRMREQESVDLFPVRGGFLVQDRDGLQSSDLEPRTVTERSPTPSELDDLLFALKVVKHVRSNAIVLAKDGAVLGIGGGQPSRVDSVKVALQKAGGRSEGTVLASDGFFPFADGVEEAAEKGVSAIIQPGGSVRDEEVVKACNQHNIAMVFTGIRHFRHK